MDNGLVVERKGKNSDLKVTDPEGQKGGQQLLDEFVEELAINLPKFMEVTGKEKANTILQIIGVGPQLAELDQKEKELYQERTYVGRTADQKEKFAKEQPYYPDAPEEPVSASELIKEQQEILARNVQRQQWAREYDKILTDLEKNENAIVAYERALRDLKKERETLEERRKAAEKTPAEMKMESTEELERSIESIETINRKVRANLDKAKAEEDAKEYRNKYLSLTNEIEDIRK